MSPKDKVRLEFWGDGWHFDLISSREGAVAFKNTWMSVTGGKIEINGQINDIDGIKFEEKKICVTKNICDFGSNLLPEIVIEKKTMSDNWDKYISSLKKIK